MPTPPPLSPGVPPPPAPESGGLSDSARQDAILSKFGLSPSAPASPLSPLPPPGAPGAPAPPPGGDVMSRIPPGLLIAVSNFLKAGVFASTGAFVVAGLLITVEAGAAAGVIPPLPPPLKEAVVGVVQPNFTPGLLVLLGFSVALGTFSIAQMGSDGAVYKEPKE
ncbi:hypothetical protein TeGR_g14384 [Tetraparma gracilis]|uniref:Uncharacterized protein n=1 Tax=Tetraparma gracilis TaxID=2962635 RepID=A0ABQ6N175_9STRA|nr:hypothetical protein TeGR_g14384 [Tetraparma gracilis]